MKEGKFVMYNDYSSGFDELAGLAGAGTIFGAMFAVIAAIWIIALVVVLALYILKAIPIYILSKKAGRNYPWLAFIPYLQTYALATIGEGPVTIPLVKKTIEKRSTAFWIYFAISLGLVAVSMVVGALAAIPFIGVLFGLVGVLIPIAVSVVLALFNYAFYYDIFKLYQPENTNNKVFAVLCALSPYICADLLSTIFLYTLIKKAPVFTQNEQETIVVS